MERIQKILAARGIASRRACEELIVAGRVTCNGKVCVLGQTADSESDVIMVDGYPIPEQQKKLYIMLNKPKGYVTTMSDEKGRKNVSELVADCPQRVYPVGRLDMDSEGLLIMTNDGEFANRLMHPSNEINKVYSVTVKGYTDVALDLVKKPIVLDGYKIQKPKVEVISVLGDQAQLRITIQEGRNRQVRRMCAAAGMQVKRLVRIAEGNVVLGQLASGKWRYLTEKEVSVL